MVKDINTFNNNLLTKYKPRRPVFELF